MLGLNRNGASSELLDASHIQLDFPVLRREVHGRQLIYLDGAATSQKPQVMIDRMIEIYGHKYARAEEGHNLSREATKPFEGVRAQVASSIHAKAPQEIIFCHGATEALELVSRFIHHAGLREGDEILLTQAEHHSSIVPSLLVADETEARIRMAPLTVTGDIALERYAAALNDRTRIVGATYVSNVNGAILPVKEMIRLAKEPGVPVLVDGAQPTRHLPVAVQDIGCDLYAGSGHLMGGPASVGFLSGTTERLEQAPAADGGSTMAQRVSFDSFEAMPPPHEFEAAKPAFGEVAAWGPAISNWTALRLNSIAAYATDLTRHGVERLQAIDVVRLLGRLRNRIAVIFFVVEGQDPKGTEKRIDERGTAVRAGNFEAKPLLRFFGVEKAARASLMVYNTREEVDLLAGALEERRLKGAHNRSSAPLRHRRCPRFRKPWVRRTPPRMAMQKARRFATPCRLSGSGLIPPLHHVSSGTQGG